MFGRLGGYLLRRAGYPSGASVRLNFAEGRSRRGGRRLGVPGRVGPGLGARVGHYPITKVMVTLYAATMLVAPSLMAGGGRLGEFAGVFP